MTFLINPKLPRTSLTARYWLSIEQLIVQSFRESVYSNLHKFGLVRFGKYLILLLFSKDQLNIHK